MNHYRISIHGKNFIVNLDGRKQQLGFYTTHLVLAEDPESAELRAVQFLRERQSLRNLVQNSVNDPPEMFVEEIVELATFDGIDNLETGLVWYDPDSDE